VAISSRSKSFINTDCFSQVLNRIWYKKLSTTDKSFFWNLKFTISFLTLGLLAPFVMLYCPAEDITNDIDKVSVSHEFKIFLSCIKRIIKICANYQQQIQ
jgi:hypothetical protein